MRFLLFIGLILIACSSKKETTEMQKEMVPQSLIVLLKPDLSPKKILGFYDQLNTESVQLISKSQNQVSVDLVLYEKDLEVLMLKMKENETILEVNEVVVSSTHSVTSGVNDEFGEVDLQSTLIVTLTIEADAKKVLSGFKEIRAESIKPISKSQNQVSCKVSVSKDKLERLIEELRKHPDIIKAKRMSVDTNKPTNSINDNSSETKPLKK